VKESELTTVFGMQIWTARVRPLLGGKVVP
jgi:hypothetical protein